MDKEKAERIIKIVNWVRYIILAVFLTFVFVALSKAQTTHDFGVWYSAGMEKKISADWNAGIGTELRTKHRREYIDRFIYRSGEGISTPTGRRSTTLMPVTSIICAVG